MKPLVVLLAVFIIICAGSKLMVKDWNLLFAGNLAMCVMLIFAASGHFLFTKGMTMMLPRIIPMKRVIIYFTGVLEIITGLALMFPFLQYIAGWILIAYYVLLLPANINSAFNRVDIEHANYSGPGLRYLWFRIPLQLFLICWTAYFSTQFFQTHR